jgi:DNA-binding CsgD family transcriptional regulator/catechol 2,3-dioxygenase-like lactoylglutathione lyase family enzyme
VSSAPKRGRPPHPDVLTPAEWRIVHAVRHGMSNRDIARRRGISRDAVKFHIGNALGKLGLERRTDLRRWHGAPFDSPRRPLDDSMSTPLALGRIGQISREVKDLDRAVVWFRDVVGLPLLGHYGTLATFDMGGVRLFLTREEAGSTTGNSILYFKVDDIEAAFSALQARGVEFRGAPHMIFRHPDGTEEWMAFFDDVEGCPLAIMSQVAP